MGTYTAIEYEVQFGFLYSTSSLGMKNNTGEEDEQYVKVVSGFEILVHGFITWLKVWFKTAHGFSSYHTVNHMGVPR